MDVANACAELCLTCYVWERFYKIIVKLALHKITSKNAILVLSVTRTARSRRSFNLEIPGLTVKKVSFQKVPVT